MGMHILDRNTSSYSYNTVRSAEQLRHMAMCGARRCPRQQLHLACMRQAYRMSYMHGRCSGQTDRSTITS